MKSARWIAAVMAWAMAPGIAGAQAIDSPYRFVEQNQSIGFGAGWIVTDPGTLELGPRSGVVPQARYTIRISGPFIAEATLGYLQSDRLVVDTANVDSAGNVFGATASAEIGILLATGTLRFDVTGPRTWNGLLPYFLVGGGAAIEMSKEDSADGHLPSDVRYDFGTTFAGQLGAGVEWLITSRFGLQLDARDVIWRVRTPAPFLLQDRPVPDEEWVQNFLFSAGLTFHF